MKAIETGRIISNKSIAANIYDMIIECPQIAQQAKPGQFAELYTGRGEYLLPRPISICEIKDKGLRLVYQIIGKGTEIFASLKEGDSIRLLGPCGNGYTLRENKTALLVGGGIGVPPLLETAKALKAMGIKVTAVLASRSAELSILKEDFERTAAEVYIATDDGSLGFKGNAVELLREKGLTANVIYSCGPKIMLRFLTDYAVEIGAECQVSMEERMACGIGACVGCAVKIKDGEDGKGWQHKKVCKDGPVFEGREVVWQ